MGKESIQMERKQLSTFRKETDRNMKRIHMKIVNNDENLDITIKGERLGEERKIQNSEKRSKKRRVKEMESKYGKEKIIEMVCLELLIQDTCFCVLNCYCSISLLLSLRIGIEIYRIV